MKLHLTLEKDGVIKLESVNLSHGIHLGEFAKKIRHYIDDNWKLKAVKCKDKRLERFFQNQITKYEANPEKFSVPILDTVKIGLEIAKTEYGYKYETWKENIEKHIEKQSKDQKT